MASGDATTLDRSVRAAAGGERSPIGRGPAAHPVPAPVTRRAPWAAKPRRPALRGCRRSVPGSRRGERRRAPMESRPGSAGRGARRRRRIAARRSAPRHRGPGATSAACWCPSWAAGHAVRALDRFFAPTSWPRTRGRTWSAPTRACSSRATSRASTPWSTSPRSRTTRAASASRTRPGRSTTPPASAAPASPPPRRGPLRPPLLRSVYGFHPDHVLCDEDAAPSPLTTYAAANLRAEADILPLASDASASRSCARPPSTAPARACASTSRSTAGLGRLVDRRRR